MPTLDENREVFDGSYEWADGGEEWSQVWGGSEAQWWGCLMPRLRRYLPAHRVVEIGCGYGRWSRFLREVADELVLVDLAARCVADCRERFGGDPGVRVEQNDGLTLPVAAASIDFVFSFDSLVHCEIDVVAAYLGELARGLATEGFAFLHHSNLAACGDLAGQVAMHHQWRARTVSAAAVAALAGEHGLSVVSQETVNWGGSDVLTDCFTVLGRPGTHGAPAPRCRDNSRFMAEAQAVREVWELYGGELGAVRLTKAPARVPTEPQAMAPSEERRPVSRTSAETSVWRSPLPWRDRYRIWRRGGRRVRLGWADSEDLTEQLTRCGLEVVPYRIDVAAFWSYVDQVGYRSLAYWQGGQARAATEKWLEHFVSIELLGPRVGELLIDVASCHSPFPDIVRDGFGVTAYRQDLLYPLGVEGDRIGGDAVSMPLPASSVDLMTLHCSFEHFEQDRDGAFLREADRVLRPGGRLCILPLYTNRRYCIQTNLDRWRASCPPWFERDALVCQADGWEEVHGRFYDPEHLVERVLGNLGSLEARIVRVENAKEVAEDCYLVYAAVLTRR